MKNIFKLLTSLCLMVFCASDAFAQEAKTLEGTYRYLTCAGMRTMVNDLRAVGLDFELESCKETTATSGWLILKNTHTQVDLKIRGLDFRKCSNEQVKLVRLFPFKSCSKYDGGSADLFDGENVLRDFGISPIGIHDYNCN